MQISAQIGANQRQKPSYAQTFYRDPGQRAVFIWILSSSIGTFTLYIRLRLRNERTVMKQLCLLAIFLLIVSRDMSALDRREMLFEHKEFGVYSDLIKYICVGQGFSRLSFQDEKGNLVLGSGFLLQMNDSTNSNRIEIHDISEFNLVRQKQIGTWGFVDPEQVFTGERGISPDIAINLVAHQVKEAIEVVKSIIPAFDDISYTRQVVLIDMAYNLGDLQFRKFKKMITAINNNDWEAAIKEMTYSKWFSQVKSRAVRNITAVRENKQGSLRYKVVPMLRNAISDERVRQSTSASVRRLNDMELEQIMKATNLELSIYLKETHDQFSTTDISRLADETEKVSRKLLNDEDLEFCGALELFREVYYLEKSVSASGPPPNFDSRLSRREIDLYMMILKIRASAVLSQIINTVALQRPDP